MKTPNIQSIYFYCIKANQSTYYCNLLQHLLVTTFPHFAAVKKEGGPNMKLNRNDYTVEAAAGGGFTLIYE